MTGYTKLRYDLPTSGDVFLTGLNDKGVAVGYSEDSTHESGFISSGAGASYTRVDYPGSDSTEPHGIDGNGDVFGFYFDAGREHAFARLADGAYVPLEPVAEAAEVAANLHVRESAILAASASGRVVGTFTTTDGSQHLFTADLKNGTFADFQEVELNDQQGNKITAANIGETGINDSGEFVGYYSINGKTYGFLEQGSTTTSIESPYDAGTLISGINSKGELVGYSTNRYGSATRSFTYEDGEFNSIDIDGSNSNPIAVAINDAGDVTGSYNVPGGEQSRIAGFVLTADGELTTIDNGNDVTGFNAINNAGTVGGITYNTNGRAQAIVYGSASSPPAAGDVYVIASDPDPESVPEGTAPGTRFDITFTVSRSDSTNAGSVEVDFGGTSTHGTGTSDDDYTVEGLDETDRLSFAAGQGTKTVTLHLVPDGIPEADESVIATLSNVNEDGGTISRSNGSATATIMNDDAAPPPASGPPVSGPPAANPPPGGSPSPNPPSNNTAAPSVAFDPDIAVAPGDVVTLSGTYAAAAGIGSIVISQSGGVLGAATVDPDGTWSLTTDFTGLPGPHTGITATATDAQGQTGTARSPYDLTTDYSLVKPDGYPYRTVQDRLDPTGAYTGSVFFNRNGSEYLESQYQTAGNGNSTYTYSGGSYFDGKGYSSFADHYDVQGVGIYNTDGALTWHAVTDNDGTQTVSVYGGSQTLDAGDPAAPNGTRFVFSPHLGDETIVNFITGGPGHDRIDLGHAGAGRLAAILNNAQDDGAGNTVLSIGHGTTLTLAGVAPGELTRRDFAMHG